MSQQIDIRRRFIICTTATLLTRTTFIIVKERPKQNKLVHIQISSAQETFIHFFAPLSIHVLSMCVVRTRMEHLCVSSGAIIRWMVVFLL